MYLKGFSFHRDSLRTFWITPRIFVFPYFSERIFILLSDSQEVCRGNRNVIQIYETHEEQHHWNCYQQHFTLVHDDSMN